MAPFGVGWLPVVALQVVGFWSEKVEAVHQTLA
jgi:hypothetical protein